MLNKQALEKALADRKIICEPIAPSQISIGSIDVRLDPIILRPLGKFGGAHYRFKVDPTDGSFVTVGEHVEYQEIDISKEPFMLYPGGFILASTYEVVGQDSLDYECVILGKSSIARTGIQVEAAGLVEAGNSLKITLEMFNAGNLPVKLEPMMQIAQVRWNPVASDGGPPKYGYEGKYKNSMGVQAPK